MGNKDQSSGGFRRSETGSELKIGAIYHFQLGCGGSCSCRVEVDPHPHPHPRLSGRCPGIYAMGYKTLEWPRSSQIVSTSDQFRQQSHLESWPGRRWQRDVSAIAATVSLLQVCMEASPIYYRYMHAWDVSNIDRIVARSPWVLLNPPLCGFSDSDSEKHQD